MALKAVQAFKRCLGEAGAEMITGIAQLGGRLRPHCLSEFIVRTSTTKNGKIIADQVLANSAC